MSYWVEDKEKIEGYRVFFSLSTGERISVWKLWAPDEKKLAEKEAARLPEGKVSLRYGKKKVEVPYPVCPKCGHQGKATGMRDSNYNGGGEYFHCLNPECKHEWCWS